MEGRRDEKKSLVCPLDTHCPLGLTEGRVWERGDHIERLMKAVFGDGNGNEGMRITMERREAQLSLLMWVFGPSSIIGLLVAILSLIIQAKGH